MSFEEKNEADVWQDAVKNASSNAVTRYCDRKKSPSNVGDTKMYGKEEQQEDIGGRVSITILGKPVITTGKLFKILSKAIREEDEKSYKYLTRKDRDTIYKIFFKTFEVTDYFDYQRSDLMQPGEEVRVRGKIGDLKKVQMMIRSIRCTYLKDWKKSLFLHFELTILRMIKLLEEWRHKYRPIDSDMHEHIWEKTKKLRNIMKELLMEQDMDELKTVLGVT
jgi:hypothetical protein